MGVGEEAKTMTDVSVFVHSLLFVLQASLYADVVSNKSSVTASLSCLVHSFQSLMRLQTQKLRGTLQHFFIFNLYDKTLHLIYSVYVRIK